jgi:hypothetical protein
MIATTELEIQAQMTQAFINTDPEEIVMMRPGRVRNPDTGAWEDSEGVPQDPQTVRIQEYQTNAGPLREVVVPGGEVEMPELYLLAMPGANIKEKDWFFWRSVKWQIDTIHPKPDYELRGDVVRYVAEV